MRRALRKNHRKSRRHYKRHPGFLEVLKRYLDILSG